MKLEAWKWDADETLGALLFSKEGPNNGTSFVDFGAREGFFRKNGVFGDFVRQRARCE